MAELDTRAVHAQAADLASAVKAAALRDFLQRRYGPRGRRRRAHPAPPAQSARALWRPDMSGSHESRPCDGSAPRLRRLQIPYLRSILLIRSPPDGARKGAGSPRRGRSRARYRRPPPRRHWGTSDARGPTGVEAMIAGSMLAQRRLGRVCAGAVGRGSGSRQSPFGGQTGASLVLAHGRQPASVVAASAAASNRGRSSSPYAFARSASSASRTPATVGLMTA
jgi:hypothetical protein